MRAGKSEAKMNQISSPAPGSLTVGFWSEFLQNSESELIWQLRGHDSIQGAAYFDQFLRRLVLITLITFENEMGSTLQWAWTLPGQRIGQSEAWADQSEASADQ